MFEQHDDAIDLLKRDHRAVEELFTEFAKAADENQRMELAQRICSELSIHAKVEEELFYPAARDALGHDDAALVDEASVEHGSLKRLIGDIDGSAPDEMFSARMQVLKEYVQHHVREEETQLMPAMRRTVMDLDTLGDSIAQRKQALAEQAEFAMTMPAADGRIHVPGAEPQTTATNQRRSTKRASRKTAARKTASRKAKSAPRARARPAKRRAAGKRKSNPASQRRSVGRRKV